jgi:hypothetical protein
VDDGVDTAHPIMQALVALASVRRSRCCDVASFGFTQKKRFPADALFGRRMMEDRRMQLATVMEMHLHDSSSS